MFLYNVLCEAWHTVACLAIGLGLGEIGTMIFLSSTCYEEEHIHAFYTIYICINVVKQPFANHSQK